MSNLPNGDFQERIQQSMAAAGQAISNVADAASFMIAPKDKSPRPEQQKWMVYGKDPAMVVNAEDGKAVAAAANADQARLIAQAPLLLQMTEWFAELLQACSEDTMIIYRDAEAAERAVRIRSKVIEVIERAGGSIE